jgi:hypothetical protein
MLNSLLHNKPMALPQQKPTLCGIARLEKEELAWAKKSLKLAAETTFFVKTSLTPWSQPPGGRLQIFWDFLRCKRLRRSH